MSELQQLKEKILALQLLIEQYERKHTTENPSLRGGDTYFYIDSCGQTHSTELDFDNCDSYRHIIGNIFKTEKEADYHKDMQKLAASIKCDYKPNWKDAKDKFFMSFDMIKKQRVVNVTINLICSKLMFRSIPECYLAFRGISDTDLEYIITHRMV